MPNFRDRIPGTYEYQDRVNRERVDSERKFREATQRRIKSMNDGFNLVDRERVARRADAETRTGVNNRDHRSSGERSGGSVSPLLVILVVAFLVIVFQNRMPWRADQVTNQIAAPPALQTSPSAANDLHEPVAMAETVTDQPAAESKTIRAHASTPTEAARPSSDTGPVPLIPDVQAVAVADGTVFDDYADALAVATVKALVSGRAEKWSEGRAEGYVIPSEAVGEPDSACRNVYASVSLKHVETDSAVQRLCATNGSWQTNAAYRP